MDLAFDLPTVLLLMAGILAFTFTRYIALSGLWYLVSYHWLKGWFAPHKLDQRYATRAEILGELKLGALNMINFCGFGALILWLHVHGYTRFYGEVEQHGWLYLVGSVALVFVIQDAFFYWVHRLLHTKFFMRHVHGAHHRFRNPSPFAAFAVHPVEGFFEVGFRPLIVCLVPLHPYAIAVLLTLSFVINVFGHGGVEVMFSGWTRHPLLGLINTPTHHYAHHKYVVANFSLYFTWWDKLMGTEHARYHEDFEAAAVPLPTFVAPEPTPSAPAPSFAQISGSCSGRFGYLG